MPTKTILIIGAGEYISHEEAGAREQIMLATLLNDVEAGTWLGRARGAGTATPSPRSGNVGNGAMPTVTLGAGAKEGRHIFRVTGAAANAGAFVHEDPDGQQVGTGNIASAYNKGGISVTWPDGATDYAVDDVLYVDVAYALGQYKPLDPTATDGSENFAGFLFERRAASVSAQRAVASVRRSVINGNKIQFGTGITVSPTQKALLEAQAAKAGCIIRY